MELSRIPEQALRASLNVMKFIGERAVGGAWAELPPVQAASLQIHRGVVNYGALPLPETTRVYND